MRETMSAMRLVMKNAYDGEMDLFPVRLCFEMLLRDRKEGP